MTATHRVGRRFRNPWSDSEPRGLRDVIRWSLQRRRQNLAPDPPPGTFPLAQPTFARRAAAGDLSVTWVGHATVLLQLGPINVLTDPMWSERASPVSFAGPRRLVTAGVDLEALPTIDVVLISHDHYDHLDMDTVRHLAARGSRFFVPLGVGAHLERWGVPPAQIEELAWWEERTLGGVRFVCTPTRHYSGRGLRDHSATLWSSWSAIGPQHRFFYSGDTGYSTLFQEIGSRLGPFDMAFIKTGAYGPGAAWADIHMPPEQSVHVLRDVRAKRMFPVHWSTFNLAYHDWDEPIRRAVAEARRTGVELVTPRLGEWVDADLAFASTPWWEAVR